MICGYATREAGGEATEAGFVTRRTLDMDVEYLEVFAPLPDPSAEVAAEATSSALTRRRSRS